MSLVERAARLTAWAVEQASRRGHAVPVPELQAVSGDASFRRYFRLATDAGPFIAVDAPPDKENLRPFVAIARALRENGSHAPDVLAVDHELGFMLLEDFGDRLLLPALNDDSADALYGLAMRELVRLQDVADVHGYRLPPYDRARLMTEMELFRDWFVKVHLELELTAGELAVLDDACMRIADDNLAQPTVFVHRDYHSRNLMLLDAAHGVGELGIIDFQDAVTGPVTYDLVSLLRDAYVVWPPERVAAWARQCARLLRDERRIDVDDTVFMRWFDWMGAQRHLKVVGIFARLWHRDGKAGYLEDIPRVFNYLLGEIRDYPELAPLDSLLRTRILPAYLAKKPEARSFLTAL
ncbi:MAG: aminoglycoside phosphotransferase family protein [Pseudomonadota bacterium]